VKFIYIENYLKVSRTDKLDFFTILGAFKNFKVKHQKVILDDNCILLEFTEDSDIEFAKKTLEAFFEDIKQEGFKINVRLVKKIVQDENEIAVTFNNNEQRRTKI
jgi:CRISPR/Cas system CSM-associated protein Csm2 small subunit